MSQDKKINENAHKAGDGNCFFDLFMVSALRQILQVVESEVAVLSVLPGGSVLQPLDCEQIRVISHELRKERLEKLLSLLL